MTPQQIASAELEKMHYGLPKDTIPSTPWIQNGRVASQTLRGNIQKTTYQIVVAFTEPASHEIEESWCQKI